MPDKKKLKKIVGELNKASKTHASQANRINSMLKKTSPALAKISASCKAQAKHKIAVVPTIIIFKDGEEVARFQADLSFKMLATKEEIQEEINNQLMSDF